MNGFKFIDLKCLAMMVPIIMAFCGDAGQYLLIAATLIWLIAKVLELHRSRKRAPPAQKGKEPAKPASSPAVQPAPANHPAAGAQQPKPAAAKPQPIDPETEAVMLRCMAVGNGKAAGAGSEGRFVQNTPLRHP